MFDTSEFHIDSSLSMLGSTSNPLVNNSVNPLQPDLTGLGTQQLVTFADDKFIAVSQYQANPTQTLVYAAGSIFNTLNQAIEATKENLGGLIQNPQMDNILGVSFGNYNKSIADKLFNHFAQQNFTNSPNLVLVSDQIFNGAYAQRNNTIYLSQEFLEANSGNVGAVTGVLLEEFGHYIDGQINVKDAAGDEGDIFSKLVQGKQLDSAELGVLHLEDDHGLIVVDNVELSIEQNSPFSKQDLTDFREMKGDLTNLIVGDFNGDDKDDFIRQEKGSWANDDNNTANLYLSQGNGTFLKQNLIDAGEMKGDLTNLIVGDYNGDGKDDFIRQEKGSWDDDDNNTGRIYLSTGNGTFSRQDLTDSWHMKGDLTNLIVGDYNGDGKDDFIRQEKGFWDDDDNNTANLYLSQGNGTFSKQNLIDAGEMKGDLTNLIVGDYNGDGKDDFIRQEKGSWDDDDNNTGRIYLSTGNGTFSRQDLTDSWHMKGDLTNLIVGDFNGDGKDDFIRQEKGFWDDDDNNTANIYLYNPPKPIQSSLKITDAVNFINPEQQYYQARDITGDKIKETLCNWFVADVLDYLGVPVPRYGTDAGSYVKPHPLYGSNTPNKPFEANKMFDWLSNTANGWKKVTAAQAVEAANLGIPGVAIWKNPVSKESGHIALVRPSESTNDPRIAQAGGKMVKGDLVTNNFKDGSVTDGFGGKTPTYFIYTKSYKSRY
jgi:FG-GAP-like repeat